jgi:hypothetical protein
MKMPKGCTNGLILSDTTQWAATSGEMARQEIGEVSFTNLRRMKVSPGYPVREVNRRLVIEGEGRCSVSLGMKLGRQSFETGLESRRFDLLASLGVSNTVFKHGRSFRHPVGGQSILMCRGSERKGWIPLESSWVRSK